VNDLEQTVRNTLHAIADDAGPPAGPSTAERAIDRYRRDRRRRAGLWATAAATVVIAAGIPTALGALGALTGPTGQNESAVAVEAPTDPQPTTEPSAPEPQPAVSAPVGGEVETGPPDPEIGVAYPFALYTHCGVRQTSFGGREWRAVELAPEPADLPDEDGIASYDGYTRGTMTLLAEDLLRFTVTDRYAEGRGLTFDFVPLPETEPGPPCA
jgi:hypothetical protein